MSLAAIRVGLYAHVTACGPWLASEVSTCAFDVLESAAASALTLFPEGTTEISPLTFGGQSLPGAERRLWRIGGTLWIRDLNSPTDMLNRIWLGYDDLYNTFHKDDTLGNTAQKAQLVGITHQIANFREAGGQVWKPVDFTLVIEEF